MTGVRTRNRLKALAVEKQTVPGVYADGGGLSLIVTDADTKKWELRIAICGRRRQLGLGVYPAVSLDAARQRLVVEVWLKDPEFFTRDFDVARLEYAPSDLAIEPFNCSPEGVTGTIGR